MIMLTVIKKTDIFYNPKSIAIIITNYFQKFKKIKILSVNADPSTPRRAQD